MRNKKQNPLSLWERVGVRGQPAALNQPWSSKLIYNQGPGCVW